MSLAELTPRSVTDLPSPPSLLRVLIIDNDEEDRELFCDALRQISSEMIVVVCGSLDLAQYLFEVQEFDCVLLDFHLIDGVAQGPILQLREAAGNQHLPVVVMSSYGTEAKAANALRNGASDYLAKNKITKGALERSIDNSIAKATLAMSLEQERQNLRQANDNLTRKNREVQSFYHTVSHELKTPITAIREFCALLHDGVLGPANAEQVESMKTVLGCCDRLTHLVNDLFDAARVETGKLELRCQPTDVAELLREELAVQGGWITDHKLKLTSDIAPDLSLVQLDPMRIRQVLSNLIRNAVKFTEPGGEIKVSARQLAPGNTLEVQVQDNGYGIASEHADFIFDRLYQCNPQGESSQNGMGIGLYLCSQIVRQHRGEISVDSVLGQGSTFRFSLPLE